LADKAAEAQIRQAVQHRFPEHGFIGEEYGEDRPDAEFVWVLDPIDGTRAFICGLPVWTTLIGLRHRGEPVIGVIGQSYLGEVFVGSRRGSRLIRGEHSRNLEVRKCPSLAQALLATTDPMLFTGVEGHAWSALKERTRLARYGCDAYAYAMVAAGALDLVVETGLKAWDIEAAIPIVRGAGGRISRWDGGPIGRTGGQMLISGDQRVHEEALSVLASAASP
jgi:histidinol phosphatase-like enzyme (inositol monophosphatase family)